MSKLRILFVIGARENTIGGHTLSMISIANGMQNRGFDVGVLLAPVPYPVTELENCGLRIHFAKILSGHGSILSHPFNIYHIVKKYHYDVIIGMDWWASLYSCLAVNRFKTPIVQVIAGGEGPVGKPLNLPGIVVFSSELMDILPKKYGLPIDNFLLSPGRVDFNSFRKDGSTSHSQRLGFNTASPKILCVSRLKFNKAPAISALFDQIELVAMKAPIQCFVVGDGDSRVELEEQATAIRKKTENRADIRFLGMFRVDTNILNESDIVVGQGRTVLEAIASGVPAAVSGPTGYFGLITPETFPHLASTNFTGRRLKAFSTLSDDLEILDDFRKTGFSQLYDMAYRMYDASAGAETFDNAITLVNDYFQNDKPSRWKLAKIWMDSGISALAGFIKRRLAK